ncbi:hypothetical protein ACJMK2_002058 [Sinanodonta woodiana]|uniref:FLYWCH-type domain-containing protein n=1 Tax=Sinanodonta woodiana TaxID=1069815 RepID=A0ABD3XU33_SINWO
MDKIYIYFSIYLESKTLSAMDMSMYSIYLATGVISYKCEKRRRNVILLFHCKGKNKDIHYTAVENLNAHTHAPDTARSVETEETVHQILCREIQYLSEEASVKLVHIQHLRRQVQRKRQLPEVYNKRPNGENFLLIDSGVGDTNIIVFFKTDKTSF